MATNVATLRGPLDLAELQLPPWRPLQSIEVEDYVDTDGLDALRVWLVLSDDVTDEELADPVILDIDLAILNYLRAHGEHLFPYIFIVPASERGLAVEEDDENAA